MSDILTREQVLQYLIQMHREDNDYGLRCVAEVHLKKHDAALREQLAACEIVTNLQKSVIHNVSTEREHLKQQLATAQATITQRENEINELTRSIARIRTEEIAPLHEQHQQALATITRLEGECQKWREEGECIGN